MLLKRPRRNRKSPAIRALSQETFLHPTDFIIPLFVIEGENRSELIPSMPNICRLSIDKLLIEAENLASKGIRAIMLFPYITSDLKDIRGSEAIRSNNLICRATKALKKELPELCIITDIALDPYTTHGHDGVVSKSGEVLNDPTLEILSQMALAHAEAGADIVAPSDMMDGRVKEIRQALDQHDFFNVAIMSYTAKYASALYGPFRDALGSAPQFGDKKSYQMNPANVREALIESKLDEEEGADFLMVKPALPYLDVLCKIREQTSLPIGAYQVSGEYSMIMAAAEKGWINADNVLYETALSIKRAGANYILTYGIHHILPLL